VSTETITANGGKVSDIGTKVDEADMDQMVQRASVPNLASLFKRGKEAGLIKPGTEYGHTA
jgi:hypothetical protein